MKEDLYWQLNLKKDKLWVSDPIIVNSILFQQSNCTHKLTLTIVGIVFVMYTVYSETCKETVNINCI